MRDQRERLNGKKPFRVPPVVSLASAGPLQMIAAAAAAAAVGGREDAGIVWILGFES